MTQITKNCISLCFCFLKIKGVQEIVHPSDLDVLQNAISEKQLVEKAEMPFLTFIEVGFRGRLKFGKPFECNHCFQVSMANNRYAFEMQEVKDLLKDEVRLTTTFDSTKQIFCQQLILKL